MTGRKFKYGSIAYKDKACMGLHEDGSNPSRTITKIIILIA